MSRVILSSWAQADLKDIGRHISQHDDAASKRWIRKLKKTCKETIGMFPECGTQCDRMLPGMRRFSIGSYLIYFKNRNPVRILRIVHGGMDQDQLHFEP